MANAKKMKVDAFRFLGGLVLVSLIISALYLWAMFPWNTQYGEWAFGLSLYLLVLGLSILLFGHGLASRWGGYSAGCRRAVHWLMLWHGFTSAITMLGGVIGVLLFSLAGVLLGLESDPVDWLSNGLRNGGFYAFIWAPGLSLVGCFMVAFGKR